MTYKTKEGNFREADNGIPRHDYMIFPREDVDGTVFDIVKDGVYVTKAESLDGALRYVDENHIDKMLSYDGFWK